MGRPLGDDPRRHRPEPEAGAEGNGRAARAGLTAAPEFVRLGREFFHPRRTRGEHDSAGDAGQEAPEIEQRLVVRAEHQHQGRADGEERRGPQQHPPPAPIGERPAEEQRRDETERIDAEERLRRADRETGVLAVGDQQRHELVGAPRDPEHGPTDREPRFLISHNVTLCAGRSHQCEARGGVWCGSQPAGTTKGWKTCSST